MPSDLTPEDTALLCIDYQERLLPTIFEREEIVKNATIMIRAAKVLGIPIVVTEQYSKGLGKTVKPVADALGDYDAIEKVHFSSFGSEEFTSHLTGAGRTNLLVMGVEAHVCVCQTVLEALRRNFKVYVLEDATSSRTERNRQIAFERMRAAGAYPASTEMVIFELLSKAGTPEFKEILKFVK